MIEGGGNSGHARRHPVARLCRQQEGLLVPVRRACPASTAIPPDTPRRNADGPDSGASRLIIDPGPRTVNATTRRRAPFDRSGEGGYATTFPPAELAPNSIDTLGEMMTDDAGRLLVLGGHGRSGTELTGPGEPHIEDYANNDGWYDDTSDGPVMARLVMFSDQVQRNRYVDVEYPAWVSSAIRASCRRCSTW